MSGTGSLAVVSSSENKPGSVGQPPAPQFGVIFKMEVLEISKNSIQDVDLLIELMHQQMQDINSEKDRTSTESAVRNALKPESRAVFFFAKLDESPIGVAFVNIGSGIESGGDYLWINEIQISPQYRGKGFGSKLLNHILQWSQKNCMKSILCVADVSNIASQSLFRSEGFEVEDIKWIKKI